MFRKNHVPEKSAVNPREGIPQRAPYAEGYVHAVEEESGNFTKPQSDDAPCLIELLEGIQPGDHLRLLIEDTIPTEIPANHTLDSDATGQFTVAKRLCGRTACEMRCNLQVDWDLNLYSKELSTVPVQRACDSQVPTLE